MSWGASAALRAARRGQQNYRQKSALKSLERLLRLAGSDRAVTLIPLRVVWTDPVGLASADASGVVRCDDGCEYAVKDDSKHSKTMHSEWFCSRLAEAVGIAVPPFKICERMDGTLVFGSRWEGGVPNEQWYEMVQNGTLKFDDVKALLANVFAFDNFVHNVDRHGKNYIVRPQKNGYALFAHDYSRAWLRHALPLTGQNTVTAARWITANFGQYLNVASTEDTLDKIESIRDSDVSSIINGHPPSWITKLEADAIVTWWSSPARKQRLDGIRQGIKDGSYL